jgi:AraC-like DNA-binding protein
MDSNHKLCLILPSNTPHAGSGIMGTDWYVRPYYPIAHWQAAKPGHRFKGDITGYEQVESGSEILESGFLYPETCTGLTFYCGPYKPYAFYSGIFTRPVAFTDLKPGTYFVVIFAPSQMHALFRIPLSEIRNQWVEVEKHRDFNLPLLIEKIACAPSFSARVAVWETHYGQWSLTHTRATTSVIRRILDWSAGFSGFIDEKNLSRFAGYTERHLRNMFYTYLGVSFKTYQRIVRYKKTLWSLSTNVTNLTDVAYDMGYYDQAHFIHEFRHFQGSTPSRFLKDYLVSNPAA